jgi:integrase
MLQTAPIKKGDIYVNKQDVLQKVDEVFQIANEKRLARVDEKGIAFKESHLKGGYRTYQAVAKRVVKNIIEVVNPLLGRTAAKYNNPLFFDKVVVDKYLEIRCEQAIEGKITSKTVKNEFHALDAFRQFSNNKEVNVFSGHKKIKIGGYEVHRERIKYVNQEVGSISYKESGWAKINTREAQAVIECIKGKDAEWVKGVLKTMLATGCRITTALKMEARHIQPEKGFVRLTNQKGGKNANLPLNKEQMNYMQERKNASKRDGSLLNQLKRNGEELSAEDKAKIMNRYLKEAAKRAGIDLPEGKRVTVHSFRKAYAQKQYDSTRGWNKDEIKKAISYYISIQGNNAKVLNDRIHREWKRLNKRALEKGKSTRDFSTEEYRTLYTSLMLSHSRIDVTRHYINRDIPEHTPNAR